MIFSASRYWTLVLGGLLTITLLACGERPLPEQFTGSPIFYLDGLRDGVPSRLAAGEDGYFMATSFSLESGDIYAFSGVLSPDGCADCPGALQISIRDEAQRNPGDEIPILQALGPGDFEYLQQGAGKTVYQVSFQSSFQGNPPQSVAWDFGDGQSSTDLNPVHTYSGDSLMQPLVCLQGDDGSGCITTICNQVNLDEPSCSIDFTYQVSDSNGFLPYVSFESEVTGQPPFRYRWNFDDGFSASLPNPIYAFGAPDKYRVCLSVTDANGCRQVLCKDVVTDPSLCAHNFSYEVTEQVVNDPFNFSKVVLSYIDEDGQKYESQLGPQPQWAGFEILESERFQDNADGNPTLRLKVRFSSLLYGAGQNLEMRDWIGYFGVAYPKS